MDTISGLAMGRMAIGTLSLISPRLAAKMFLLDPSANPQLSLVTRLFGSRELALGAITMVSSGAARKRLVTVGIAVDGADTFSGLAAAASGVLPRTAGLLFAAAAAGAVAAGVVGLDDV